MDLTKPSGRPRRQGGAPLRRVMSARRTMVDEGSSPSSGRGSIPAARAPAPARDPTGRPRRQGGAPLRQFIRRRPGRRRAGRPRRQDGAPLRRERRKTSPDAPLVVPVVRAGLHCGGRTLYVATRRRGRPRRQGGAPLRLRLGVRRAARPAGRPRRQGGAHCGNDVPASEPMRPWSSPSSGRGSIAAPRLTLVWGQRLVVPVVRAGLHCGICSRGVPSGKGRGSSPS